ncbi:serine/arginine-rich splicing factor SC35-like [Magnolia sinica]|uniref:serine/arginine-rich splicing factor SC35-like n=1 Tax=Magnolia sinica TaxID=86752 RepID=UPI0026597C0F|nr:serine/arginine-rich splicing factor SC35-like [Magnolia sinica]
MGGRGGAGAPGFSFFVSNMTFDTSEEDLHRIFGKYGKIPDVSAPWDDMHNCHRGFRFVRFHYVADVYTAIRILHGKRVDGRIITVTLANSKKASSPPKYRMLRTPLKTPKQIFRTRHLWQGEIGPPFPCLGN